MQNGTRLLLSTAKKGEGQCPGGPLATALAAAIPTFAPMAAPLFKFREKPAGSWVFDLGKH